MRLERSEASLWALDIQQMGLDLQALPERKTVVERLAGARVINSGFEFAEEYRPAVAECLLTAAARLETLRSERATPHGCDVAETAEEEEEVSCEGQEELVLWVRWHFGFGPVVAARHIHWVAPYLTMRHVCDNAMMLS